MIRIVLLGRTGNNLFQYALGRVLSKKHGVPLVLDASWFNRAGWRDVSHFLKLPLEAHVVRRYSLGARLLRKLSGKHYWEFNDLPVIREPQGDFSFQGGILNAPASCVLLGFFQSPRYFESIADELRSEINGLLRQTPNPPQALLDLLAHPCSVAVHVRRGDYLIHPELLVCDHAYYERAMQSMRAQIPNARFHVFSDDTDWCRNHFFNPDTEVVEYGHLSANPLQDLRLMSLASHHIIANSSYSWWAAWLGKKANQHVILPDRWLYGAHSPIHDRLCTGWQTISCCKEQAPASCPTLPST